MKEFKWGFLYRHVLTDITKNAVALFMVYVLYNFFFFNDTATTEIYTTYDTLSLHDALPILSAGITYDRLEFPENFRYSPLSTGQVRKDQVSPKGGFIWTPLPDTTVRAAYTRSLAGVSFDQSFQLEPSQIAGFNQMYRSLIPESVAGAIAGAEFETWGVSVDQKFKTSTYLGAQAEWLNSEARRGIGVIQFTNASFFD